MMFGGVPCFSSSRHGARRAACPWPPGIRHASGRGCNTLGGVKDQNVHQDRSRVWPLSGAGQAADRAASEWWGGRNTGLTSATLPPGPEGTSGMNTTIRPSWRLSVSRARNSRSSVRTSTTGSGFIAVRRSLPPVKSRKICRATAWARASWPPCVFRRAKLTSMLG